MLPFVYKWFQPTTTYVVQTNWRTESLMKFNIVCTSRLWMEFFTFAMLKKYNLLQIVLMMLLKRNVMAVMSTTFRKHNISVSFW